jgi:hypothetical protein
MLIIFLLQRLRSWKGLGVTLASLAFSDHLQQLLLDAEELDEAHAQLRTGDPGRQFGLASLNRAAVVMCVSAGESYLEELMRECVQVLRPAAGVQLGSWPALSVYVTALLARFNTPNPRNVERLVRESIGLANVDNQWSWQNCSAPQAAQRLAVAMNFRHEIAHGVNPRPTIHNFYSSQLPDFIRRLARCTDQVVRQHLVSVHGILNPWPV